MAAWPPEINLPHAHRNATPQQYLSSLVSFAERLRPLIDFHIVDFLTQNQWELLDPEWRDALLPEQEQAHEQWVSGLVQLAAANTSQDTWPQSLKSYVKDTQDLALPRTQLDNVVDEESDIDKRLRPGMSDKKLHEVGCMSAVVHSVAKQRHIRSVMDLGAGQGYLSRVLAYQYGLRVLAVDGSNVQTCGAKRFDALAVKRGVEQSMLEHVTDHVTQDNVSSLLSRWSRDPNEPWLVCGLHACGDLSSLMLSLFTENLSALINVGCCYHFLSQDGFPMSNFVKHDLQYQMGTIGQMLACQTPTRWADRREETLKSFEHHFFRALLQYIMVEKGLASPQKAPVLGRLNKKKDFTSFPVYVAAALKRLNLPADAITAQEAQTYYDTYKKKRVDRQIAVLWTVRALLAPILESIVLVDRWLYLKESLAHFPDTPTKGVWIWPLFDPITSPRNIVIVASK